MSSHCLERISSRFAVACLTWCWLLGCQVPKTLHSGERQLIESNIPTPEIIGSWIRSDFPTKEELPDRVLTLYRACVQRLVTQLISGQPVEIEIPNVAPCYTKTIEVPFWAPHPIDGGYAFSKTMEVSNIYVDPEFGLPAHDIPDCISEAKSIELTAKHRTLSWFAAKGIYPINSTKRK